MRMMNSGTTTLGLGFRMSRYVFFFFFFLPFVTKRIRRYGKACFFMIFFSLDGYLVFGLMTRYDIMDCISSS